jgi:hypothetical protein
MCSRICVLGLLLCVAMLGACKQADNLATAALPSEEVSADGSATVASAAAADVSEGRKNAARIILPGSTFLADLLQFDGGPGQHPCYPLGDAVLGFVPWPSRLAPAPFLTLVTSNFLQSEYDVLSARGDTEYVLSVRAGFASQFSDQFSQLEFNFRAVNPHETNHVAHGGGHYLIHEADYPSNDAVVANRSLIDLAGGPIAILIQGLDFDLIPNPDLDTTAWMNALGPQAWVAFMRDNAYQSGRFYAILGALTGGPVALRDTPPPFDDGMFRSVQVRGDTFDANSENPSTLTLVPPRCDVCPDFTPPPGIPVQPYALFDYGNFDEAGVVTPGRGGFVFVMRPPAFPAGGPVVVDPSAHPGQPPFAFPGNVIAAPGSGYAEAALDAAGLIDNPAAVDNLPVGPQGVHELSISVFFIHTGLGM